MIVDHRKLLKQLILRQPRATNIMVLLVLFYRSFIEPILISCIVAWFGNLNTANTNWLWSLVKTASKILGSWQAELLAIFIKSRFCEGPMLCWIVLIIFLWPSLSPLGQSFQGSCDKDSNTPSLIYPQCNSFTKWQLALRLLYCTTERFHTFSYALHFCCELLTDFTVDFTDFVLLCGDSLLLLLLSSLGLLSSNRSCSKTNYPLVWQ